MTTEYKKEEKVEKMNTTKITHASKLFLSMLLISIGILFIVSAQDVAFLSFNEGDDFILIQNCGTCTYVNISTMINQDTGKIILSGIQMNNNGTSFIYDLDNDLPKGTYIVNTFGNGGFNGQVITQSYYLYINPNDSSLFYFNTKDIFSIIILVLFFLASVGLFVMKNYLYSGIALLFDGVVLLFNDYNLFVSLFIIVMGVAVMSIQDNPK